MQEIRLDVGEMIFKWNKHDPWEFGARKHRLPFQPGLLFYKYYDLHELLPFESLRYQPTNWISSFKPYVSAIPFGR